MSQRYLFIGGPREGLVIIRTEPVEELRSLTVGDFMEIKVYAYKLVKIRTCASVSRRFDGNICI